MSERMIRETPAPLDLAAEKVNHPARYKGGRKYKDWLMDVLREPGRAFTYIQAAYLDSPTAFWQAIQDVADAKRCKE